MHETSFVGPGMRAQPAAALRAEPAVAGARPVRDARCRRTWCRAHVAARAGRVSLGIEVNVLPAADRGGPRPRRPGRRAGEPADAVHLRRRASSPSTWSTCAVEVDEPLPLTPASLPLDDASPAIGERVAALRAGRRDAAARASAPCRTPRWPALTAPARPAGVDGDVQRRGAAPRAGPARWTRTAARRVVPASAAAELYAWVDRNPRVRMLRTERANDPAADRRATRSMISVNTALQVDLFAQANACRVGRPDLLRVRRGRPTSSSGPCTPRRAWPSSRCAPGTRRPDVSTVVPLLDEPVTSFQPQRDRHRAGLRPGLGARPGRPGPRAHRPRGAPAGARRAPRGGALPGAAVGLPVSGPSRRLGEHRGLGAPLQAELGQQARHVVLHGLLGEEHLARRSAGWSAPRAISSRIRRSCSVSDASSSGSRSPPLRMPLQHPLRDRGVEQDCRRPPRGGRRRRGRCRGSA